MKALFITLFLIASLQGVASAQKQDRHVELPGANALSQLKLAELTRQMCAGLRLNEAQYIRLRAVNKIKLTRLEEIAWQYKDDAAQQQTLIGELEAQYQAECSRILTPSQLSLLRGEQHYETIPTQTDALEGGIG